MKLSFKKNRICCTYYSFPFYHFEQYVSWYISKVLCELNHYLIRVRIMWLYHFLTILYLRMETFEVRSLNISRFENIEMISCPQINQKPTQINRKPTKFLANERLDIHPILSLSLWEGITLTCLNRLKSVLNRSVNSKLRIKVISPW